LLLLVNKLRRGSVTAELDALIELLALVDEPVVVYWLSKLE
jgi:hypothetical protein